MKTTQITSTKNQERFVVTQSNNLVEANFSPDLTAQAHKTARFILSLISPNDKDLRIYTVRIDALKRYLGIKENTRWGAFYSRLKDTAQKLNAAPIEIRKPDGKYLVAYLISGYEVDTTKGTITFEISGLLKPYLLELKKNYTSYLLAYIPKLKSSYSIRLYELLYQYRKIGKRHFELVDLQKKIGSSYKLYGDFKRKVILQAQKDLKKHTDIAFAFAEIKAGRKVVSVEFVIFSNTPSKKQSNQLPFLEPIEEAKEEPAFHESLIKEMNILGISEQNIAKYLAKGFNIIDKKEEEKEAIIQRCKTLENYYLEKLELTKQASNSDNAAGYFIKALKENWTSGAAVKKSKDKKKRVEQSSAKRQYDQLQRQVTVGMKKKKVLEVTISEELSKDNTLLEAAYTSAFAKMTDFVKSQIVKSRIDNNDEGDFFSLPIKEQYQESFKVKLYVNLELKNMYPEKYASVIKLEKQLAELDATVAQLKEQYHFK